METMKECELLDNSAKEYMSNKEYDKALSDYQKSLELKKTFLEEEDVKLLAAYRSVGMCYTSLCQYKKAIEIHLKTVEVRNRKDTKPIFMFDTAYDYDLIARNYSLLDNHEEALKYYLLSLPIYDAIYSLNKTYDYSIPYRNIANEYILLKRDMEAIPYFYRSICIKDFLGYLDPKEIIEDLVVLEEVAIRCGDNDMATTCRNHINRIS